MTARILFAGTPFETVKLFRQHGQRMSMSKQFQQQYLDSTITFVGARAEE